MRAPPADVDPPQRAKAAPEAAGPTRRALARAVVCGLALAPAAAGAQDAESRARQASLAVALAEAPTDLELMFAYATTAMANQDFEPAIATLERMLIYRPDLPRVRLELAVAYFRLGVYDVAKSYFEGVQAADPPAEVSARIALFLDEIERRTVRHAFSGFFAIGPIYSTNANLGPPDRELRAEFFPGGVALIDADETAKPDWGAQATLSATHRYDLRGANDDAWISTALLSTRRFREASEGALDAILVTTGPQLALDDEAFGLKARPYVSAGFVRSDEAPLYGEAGIGLELTQTVDPEIALFGVASFDWRDFEEERDAFDGGYGGAFAGVAWTPERQTEFRAALLGRLDFGEEDFTTSREYGVRLSATRLFSAQRTFGVGDGTLPWRASVFTQASLRDFEGPDPDVDADETRADVDARLGLRLVAPLTARDAIAADMGYYERFSNIRNYDFSSFDIGLSYVRFF